MTVRDSLRTGLLLVSLLLAGVRPSPATQIQAMDLPRLSSDASLVVEGRVVAQRSYWNDDRTRILTETEIAVERSHKGAGPARVTVIQLGGVVDGVRMTVQGAVSWRDDEEVLLFLEPSLRGRHRLTGFSQGKFHVEVDPDTGERFAVRPVLGVETVGRDGDAGAVRMPVRQLLQRAELRVSEEGGR